MEKTPTILVANGVNLDLLGSREPALYGTQSLELLEQELQNHARSRALSMGLQGCNLRSIQTNCEAEYLEHLSTPWDFAIVNPGAWTHTSLAIGDRLAALARPYVEVHITHTHNREHFRQHSYITPHACGTILGLGSEGYFLAVEYLLRQQKAQS